jgi:predicted XRE-type DNA-binding protein
MTNKNFETSSGNIFADLGLPNPEERLVKAKLAIQINLLIKNKGLNQKEAAELLGTDQAKISALHQGKLAGFSLERLFRFLNILGQDITINLTSKTRSKDTPTIKVIARKIKRTPTAEIVSSSTVLANKSR